MITKIILNTTIIIATIMSNNLICRSWWDSIISHGYLQFNYDEVWSILLITGAIVVIFIMFYLLLY